MKKLIVSFAVLGLVALLTTASYKLPPTGSATFLDTANQTITSPTLAQIVTYNTTINARGITLTTGTGSVANSRMVFATTGEYLVTVSAVMATPGGGSHYTAIWARTAAAGGTPADVANSNTAVTNVGATQNVVAVTFIVEVTAANDVLELWMSGDQSGAGTGLVASAAGSSPTRPASPSIIVTVNKISK